MKRAKTPSPELVETRIALPEARPSVAEVVVDRAVLYYRLGAPQPLRDADGRYERDARGRVALEAFLALPVPAMHERLAAYLGSIAGTDTPPDPARYRACWHELLLFVDTFGPLGLEWGLFTRVENPEAERLEEENRRLRAHLMGLEPLVEPTSVDRGAVWRLRSPALGFVGSAVVERAWTYPGLAWERQVELRDDRVPQDDLGHPNVGPLASAHATLHQVVRIAEALRVGDEHDMRRAIAGFPRYPAFWVGDRPSYSSLEPDFRAAVKGMTPADGWFVPYREHQTHVDWKALGWNLLAEHLFWELSSTRVGVGLHAGKLAVGWRVGSLLEVMYLQLLEHIERRFELGFGMCGVCEGPILRVRLGQRWHQHCAQTGRQRVSRARRRSAVTTSDGATAEVSL